jgi:hypothetical protein
MADMQGIGGKMISNRGKIPLLSIGVVLVFFGLLAWLVDIQSSQALFLPESERSLVPSLQTLMGPIELIQGHLNAQHVLAVMWSFSLETLLLLCVVGWEVAMSAFGYHNPRLAGIFKTMSWALICFNIYATWAYGWSTEIPFWDQFWGKGFYALLIAFSSAFFVFLGAYCIEKALTSK